MSSALPFRGRAGNNARPSSAPAAFVVLASCPVGPDAARIVLRDDFAADTPDSARRFAASILPGLRCRYGALVDVQVFTLAGAPVFAAGGVTC